MTKLQQIFAEGKMQQILYLDKTLLKKLKAYAVETDTPFHKLIESEINQFTQLLIIKATRIDEIRMKALEALKKAKEEQDLAMQNPLVVSGHKEDTIGKLEIEPRAF